MRLKCVLIEHVQVKTSGILGDYQQVTGESESTLLICFLPTNSSNKDHCQKDKHLIVLIKSVCR